MSGTKHDEGKPPIDLIPYPAIVEIAKVLGYGSSKYAPYNWTKGFKWSRLIAATERHLGAFKSGQDRDEETGLMELAHAGACILFLIIHQLFSLGQDDRYKFYNKEAMNEGDNNTTDNQSGSLTWRGPKNSSSSCVCGKLPKS